MATHAPTTVKIYHGYESDGRMVFGFGEPKLPELSVFQYTYSTETHGDLDNIFRYNNAVDGTEHNVAHKARSLSVGDIIVREWIDPVDGAGSDIHIVASFGFEKVDEIPGKQISKDELTEIQDRLFA